MNRTLVAVPAVALALVSAPALAQDATTYNGLYVAGSVSLDNIGNDASTIEFDTDRNGTFGDMVMTAGGTNAFSPGFCSGRAVGNAPGAGCDDDGQDIGYSLRIGADKRLGMFVAGVLLEGSMSDATDFTTAYSTTPASYTYAREIDKQIALRGRLGISPGDGRGLIYATGGVGYADIKRRFATTNTANTFTVRDGDDMEWGWQAGAGGEVLIGRALTLGIEYLYSRYEDDSYVEVGPGTAGPTNPFLLASGGTNLRPADSSIDSHSFRVVAGFRF